MKFIDFAAKINQILRDHPQCAAHSIECDSEAGQPLGEITDISYLPDTQIVVLTIAQ